ncbi:MAG TPA: hypothetical protein VE619_08960 [Nitrososphaeraceae archaeon]|nr:hypothetical protein [Nitrososphaeraceae archaeon]
MRDKFDSIFPSKNYEIIRKSVQQRYEISDQLMALTAIMQEFELR